MSAIDDPRRADRAGALLALVGVVNVPIIYFSVQWWNTLHQGASVSFTAAPTMARTMLARHAADGAGAAGCTRSPSRCARVRCLIVRARADAVASGAAMSGTDCATERCFLAWAATACTSGARTAWRCAAGDRGGARAAARIAPRAGARRRRSRAMKPRHAAPARSPAAALAALGVAAALVLNAFQRNLVFFFSPTQVAAHEAPRSARLPHRRPGRGGQRCKRERDGLTVRFVVTDTAQEHAGALPRHAARPVPRRQGRGGAGPAAARRRRSSRREVLAKHDENYMPPEAAAALEQARQARRPRDDRRGVRQ